MLTPHEQVQINEIETAAKSSAKHIYDHRGEFADFKGAFLAAMAENTTALRYVGDQLAHGVIGAKPEDPKTKLNGTVPMPQPPSESPFPSLPPAHLAAIETMAADENTGVRHKAIEMLQRQQDIEAIAAEAARRREDRDAREADRRAIDAAAIEKMHAARVIKRWLHLAALVLGVIISFGIVIMGGYAVLSAVQSHESASRVIQGHP